ncbi:Hint domain-containing protein [Cypionkella sp.]|uniref:Hint domain-containing protein n=1 Tax=Cypionkella sp. TaxID=2811411 RepID=UPI002AC95700|nr:Hint domain-containing protein [Cypionkella sp.]
MPTSTVNWLWIGNQPLVDASPSSNVTQAQLNAAGMTGYTAFGPGQLAPVAVTGSTTASGGAQVFTAPFNPSGGFVSQFSFDSPSTAGVVTNQTVSSFFRGNVSVELPDGSLQQQVATIVQMANGDLFLRPNASFVADWDGIVGVRSITVDSALPFAQNTVLNSTISFSPNIFDIEVPCFSLGTLIDTPEGLRAVESLAVGDLVRTADHGAQVLRWINQRRVSGAGLQNAPQLRPIRIQAGALGEGCPQADLLVSPQHRMLVRSRIAQRMFDTDEVLVAAKHLVGLPGIAVAEDLAEVTYVHFLCDQHEVVFANGAPTESLYAGPMTLRALGEAAVGEIMQLFPDLAQFDSFRLSPARPLVRGSDGRHMAARHLKNSAQLLAA